MPRRFQFSLRALLILMFGVACFFGGLTIGRLRERQLQMNLLAEEKAARQRRIYAGLLRAAENPTADINEPIPVFTETTPRMPTLSQRTERMPTLREPPAAQK